MNLSPTTKRWLAIGAPVAVVVLAAAFWWFRPDALFTDRTVDEELDSDLAALLATSDEPGGGPSATPTPSVDVGASPTADADGVEPSAEPSAEPVPTATSEDDEPTTEPAPATVVLSRGDWISLEHDTSGTVALVDDDGDLQLVLSDLETDNGPDLQVILSPKEGVSGDWFGYEDGATYLGALKGNRGTQTYDVPDDLDLDDVASVVIWCERFSVGFGVANV